MAILSHSSSNLMLSLKVLLISTGVLFMAVMLNFSVPVIMEFALSRLPSVWSFVVSCLRPPYLYLVVNCIIIIIVASSRLQSNVDESSPSSSSPPETVVLVQSEAVKVPVDVPTDYAVVYSGGDFKEEVSPEIEQAKIAKDLDYDPYDHVDAKISETKTMITENASDEMSGSDEFVISKSSWSALNKATDYSFSTEKPPVSARFGHRKTVKASPEGGRTLGVSKPKRQDTLESTWKTITDGRSMPLTRHLRKSDTWETHGRHHSPQEHMAKSETFNDRSSVSSSLTPSPGYGKLRKEASPSQDELNRRVEAFIKKFNEDMRLQRQESLNQYMEMINRGAH